jgi:zinc/manganese transport system substrate-binding protein
MRPFFWFLWVLGLVIRGVGETEPIRILTTLPAIHSWAVNVVGDPARVENLLPADVGPHDFQFRPSDLRKLAKADLVLVNGLGVDEWLNRAVASGASKPGRKIVTVTDGLASVLIRHLPELEVDGGDKAGHDLEHSHGGPDPAPNPHVWLDPRLAQHGVSNILNALVAADPANAEGYTRRATAYLLNLEALDREILSSLSSLKDRRIVTFHDAFPYFCRRYGLTLTGVIEEVPSVDPSPKYLASLIGVIRKTGVRVLFSEPQFNPRLIRRLSEDLHVSVAELDVLETGRPSPTFYVDGMRKNLRSLQAALR